MTIAIAIPVPVSFSSDFIIYSYIIECFIHCNKAPSVSELAQIIALLCAYLASTLLGRNLLVKYTPSKYHDKNTS